MENLYGQTFQLDPSLLQDRYPQRDPNLTSWQTPNGGMGCSPGADSIYFNNQSSLPSTIILELDNMISKSKSFALGIQIMHDGSICSTIPSNLARLPVRQLLSIVEQELERVRGKHAMLPLPDMKAATLTAERARGDLLCTANLRNKIESMLQSRNDASVSEPWQPAQSNHIPESKELYDASTAYFGAISKWKEVKAIDGLNNGSPRSGAYSGAATAVYCLEKEKNDLLSDYSQSRNLSTDARKAQRLRDILHSTISLSSSVSFLSQDFIIHCLEQPCDFAALICMEVSIRRLLSRQITVLEKITTMLMQQLIHDRQTFENSNLVRYATANFKAGPRVQIHQLVLYLPTRTLVRKLLHCDLPLVPQIADAVNGCLNEVGSDTQVSLGAVKQFLGEYNPANVVMKACTYFQIATDENGIIISVSSLHLFHNIENNMDNAIDLDTPPHEREKMRDEQANRRLLCALTRDHLIEEMQQQRK